MREFTIEIFFLKTINLRLIKNELRRALKLRSDIVENLHNKLNKLRGLCLWPFGLPQSFDSYLLTQCFKNKLRNKNKLNRSNISHIVVSCGGIFYYLFT